MPWRRSDEPAEGARRAGRLEEETTSQTDLLTSGKLKGSCSDRIARPRGTSRSHLSDQPVSA